MIVSEKIIKEVKNYGALQYSVDDMISILALNSDDAKDFRAEFENPDSIVYRTYQQGLMIGNYNVDAALIKKSELGDKDAIEQREELIRARRIQNLKRDLFGI